MKHTSPLAERLRPKKLVEVVGQEKIIGQSSVLAQSLKSGHLPSLVLWGPPGCGKTTIARLLAQEIGAIFLQLEAVTSGLKEFRNKQTVLFIDEIHRWNKKQQDALLPYVEDGTIIFIGATTENPSFEVISALLSRLKVIILQPLSKTDLVILLQRALSEDSELKNIKINLESGEVEMIADFSGGDARVALNALELCVNASSRLGSNARTSAAGDQAKACSQVTPDIIKQVFDRTNLLYDKAGEEHYNIISAFIKSLRGSDVDAAVYYLARMIEGGEDAEFIARRLLIFSSEDIGNALPTALVVANACFDAVRKIGWPESQLILTQTTIYLAKAPKSNLSVRAISSARAEVQESGNLPIPLHLRNAPTKFMKDLGYSQGY
ncbi:MAG: ATPase, AAA family, partial [Parcubacteria group bacterium GW2011_GWC2_44_22]